MGVLSATTAPVVRQDSAEVSRLLKEASTSAQRLVLTTDQFKSYSRSNLNWQSHVQKAGEVKDEVNALGINLADLEALNHKASPWQRQVIEEMRPILVELAQNTTFVIDYIRENPRSLRNPDYREALDNKYELATQLAGLTGDSVSYSETTTRLDQLRNRLEMD